MRKRVQKAALIVALAMAWVLSASAQVQVGENVNLNVSGAISTGYSGTFSDNQGSSHGLDFGGFGALSGSYYDPRFLTFNIQPYYRRSQSDSIYQSITNGSGFTSSVNLFSGSRFPGSIGYSRTYDTTGQFGIPGVTGITAHGNGQNFNIGWSALLPDMPTLNANYSTSGGNSSVFGTDAESNSHSRNFTLQSTYDLSGFQLMGQYTHLSMDAFFPDFIEGGGKQNSESSSNSILLTAMHRLPMQGNWSVSWNRTGYEGTTHSDTAIGSNDGVVNDIFTTVSFNPVQKLGLAFGADYNDNVFGSLQQQLLEAGGTVRPELSASSHTFSTYAQGSYRVFSRLSLYGRVSHNDLALPGGNRGITQVSGSASFNYAQRLLGALTFSLGVIDTATKEGNSGANLVGSVSFVRRIGTWQVESDFGYTQQVQTLYDVYTTSTYRYDARVHRRFGGLYWSAGFNGSHSGLTQYDGFSNRHEGFTTSLQYGRYGLSGQYSQGSGSSILTPTGLVEVPDGVPLPLLQEPILYDGKSYGGGLSYRPFRRCSIAATYNKAYSNTAGGSIYSAFDSAIANARLRYRVRKLDVDLNYTRFQQSITTGNLPAVVNSYYFRVSRGFNLF